MRDRVKFLGLKKIAEEINLTVITIENPGEYVSSFRNEESSKCLVVLGSMYLLGTIKTDLERIRVS